MSKIKTAYLMVQLLDVKKKSHYFRKIKQTCFFVFIVQDLKLLMPHGDCNIHFLKEYFVL